MRSAKTIIRNYLIISALLPVVLLWTPPPGPKAPVCTNPECNARGTLYYESMQSAGNPCKNFFQFACGGWLKKNPPPATVEDWSVVLKMQKETLEQLLVLLKKPAARGDSQDLQSIRRVFNVCMNIPSLGRGNVDFLARNIEKVGRYPKTSVWDMHYEYVKMTGESPLFDVIVMADPAHNDDPLLQFSRIKSPFGSLVPVRPWNAEQAKGYMMFLVNLVMFVSKGKQPALQQQNVIKIVKNVLSFRIKLSEISRTSVMVQPRPMKSVTLSELQLWYNSHSKNSKTSEINWNKIVRNLYSNQPEASFLNNPRVGLQDEKYFVTLVGLLDKTSEETLAYHYELYFMERHLAYTAPMLEKLEQFVSKMNGYTGYVRKEDIDKSFLCIHNIHMDEAQGKLYVAKYFEKKNIPLVENILEEVRDAIRMDIMDSKWADYETKVASIRRINDLKWWIGYPPWYDDPSISRTTTLTKPAAVGAHLAIKTNRIFISAALMKSPVFDPRVPDVINFGAIGSVTGHEMYHALDDCGEYETNKGEVKTWWSNPMRARCQTRKKCYTKAYTEMRTKLLTDLKLPAISTGMLLDMSDASNTFLEDLPDAMGLQASYHAYQARLKKQKNACAVLPHFEKYSCDQMFFIAVANTLCGHQVPENAYSHTEKYSPQQLRLNAAVSNNDDFGRVFGCTKGDPMYPHKKCNFWV